MLYYTGDLFVNAEGVTGSIVAPKAYSGWFRAFQIGWPPPAVANARFANMWQPPDFQNGSCSLICSQDAQSGKLLTIMKMNTRIKKIEVHFNRLKSSQLRMLLEDAYITGYQSPRQGIDAYEHWTLDAGKGTARVLMGPRGPTP